MRALVICKSCFSFKCPLRRPHVVKECWGGQALSLPDCKMGNLKTISQLHRALKVDEALGDKATELFMSI